ncbi:glycoside hydrolase family 3 N-terminal domain-containing protein [Reichenbachiella agariperforans]|uniref:glycoside hydrolase family 3 N-terminal domain-containing protein n=1 Tax=Reichenbachiella agariperforans TaxID=156994 RepID=UPI001C094BE2|nr:glycoside hydrolase family 3 N-terminal domain-containing protein [Reichenbachiella agariperforans]MBU2915309.1 glycoside hydrolase family 3 C-terminal domain-containing protein [Reichenbachiella agariperforans]
MITKYTKFIAGIVTISIFYLASCQQSTPQTNSDQDGRVTELMSQMSVEDKVGQMTQITLSMLMKDNQLNIEELKNAIINKKVGSILNVNGTPLSIEEWHELLTSIQDIATKETTLKIPVLYGIDAIHGTTYTQGSTLFPHNIGMGATRNPDLVKQSAKITALETRASGIRWNFDPALGIARQPLWSRYEEMYGEATVLSTVLGSAAITAYEEDGLDQVTAVASCMKHFLGYSVPLSGKDRTPAYIPDTQLREIFLPPFEAAVQSGTSTVMINSGEINGVPVHASKYYLTDILRGELGFEGLAVTDWEDIIRLHGRHHVAATPKEAVKIAINAGIDMSMVPVDYSFFDYLVELVNEGEVPMSRIDEAVYRILKLKYDLGLFDNAYPEQEAIANFGKASYKDVALNAALESITLLKNEGQTLPLDKNAKVLLMGPAANNHGSLHGSWSYTWQGQDESQFADETLTLKSALEAKIGTGNVTCNTTAVFEDAANTSVDFLKKNAAKSDVIVLAIGEKSYAESPGGIHDLNLEANQIELAKAAYATGKPVVLLIAQGRPRVISPIVEGADAIVNLYRPASQGATATMEILFGDYNPNGVLPFSYPRHAGDILLYDRKHTEEVTEFIPDSYGGGGYNPQWAFGHGLSYTTFEYGDIQLDKKAYAKSETITVAIDITNTGDRDGKLAIDLFVSDLYASVTPSYKKLKKFSKENFKAGETKTVTFTLDGKDLTYINAESQKTLEAGEFTVSIGDKKSTFELK